MAGNLVTSLLTPNSQRPGGNRPGDRISPVIGVAHSTATPEASAQNVRDYFETIRPGGESSAHCVTDWNGTIVCIPFDPGNCEVCWGAGSHANKMAVQCELCETSDAGKFQASYGNFCDLWASILHLYAWAPDRIYGHWMVSALWAGDTDHTDPVDYLRSHGIEWWQFMQAIEQRLGAFSQAASQVAAASQAPQVPILVGGQVITQGYIGPDNHTWARLVDVVGPLGFTATAQSGANGVTGVTITPKS